VICKRVGDPAAFFDQFHRGLRFMTLRDEDARAHRHAAVTTIGTVSINLAAVTDRFERGSRTINQFMNGQGKEGTVNTTQPQQAKRWLMQIRLGTECEAHVDDEPHTQFAQAVVIFERGMVADEEIISDLGKIHSGILSQAKRFSTKIVIIYQSISLEKIICNNI